MIGKNTLYPGLPGYTGPNDGLFGLIHHDTLAEYSANIAERVDYIRREKPGSEIATRLRCLVYLPQDRLPPKYGRATAECGRAWAECGRAIDEYGRARAEYDRATAEYGRAWAEYDRARAEYDRATAEYGRARAEYGRAIDEYAPQIEALIRELVPDCPWDGTQIVFS